MVVGDGVEVYWGFVGDWEAEAKHLFRTRKNARISHNKPANLRIMRTAHA